MLLAPARQFAACSAAVSNRRVCLIGPPPRSSSLLVEEVARPPASAKMSAEDVIRKVSGAHYWMPNLVCWQILMFKPFFENNEMFSRLTMRAIAIKTASYRSTRRRPRFERLALTLNRSTSKSISIVSLKMEQSTMKVRSTNNNNRKPNKRARRLLSPSLLVDGVGCQEAEKFATAVARTRILKSCHNNATARRHTK